VSCPPNKQSNAVLHISRKCCRCSRANPIKTRVVRVPRLRSVSVPVCQKQSTTFKQRLGQHTECMQAYQQDHAPSHTSNMKSYTRTHNTHMGHAWTLLRIKRRRGSRDSGIQISLAQTATYAPGATSMHEVRLHPHWAHETHNVCKATCKAQRIAVDAASGVCAWRLRDPNALLWIQLAPLRRLKADLKLQLLSTAAANHQATTPPYKQP
jgi:hypothetical protein